MLNIQTTQLLEEVVVCLKTTIANGPVLTDKKIRTLREIGVESFKDNQGEEISRLFATIQLLLSDHACKIYSDEHDTSHYLSGVRAYLYYGHILEVSIMNEKRSDSELNYYYIGFSFPEAVHLYEVIEIFKKWVPTFSTRKEDVVNDDVFIRHIATIVAKTFDTFCSEFVSKNRFRRREFSVRAIQPLFSVSKRPSKTRKRNKPGETTYDMESKDNPVYDRLKKLFCAMTDKPSETARLFAIIHDLLISIYACKISNEENQWPAGPSYDGTVHDIFYSETVVDDSVPVNAQLINWHAFQLSLLTNEKEFYICVRFLADSSKKCFKKIVKTLIPSFDPKDSNLDRERINNITMWLSGLIEHFIKKVITGSYHSNNPSFVSSVEGSEDETP